MGGEICPKMEFDYPLPLSPLTLGTRQYNRSNICFFNPCVWCCDFTDITVFFFRGFFYALFILKLFLHGNLVNSTETRNDLLIKSL